MSFKTDVDGFVIPSFAVLHGYILIILFNLRKFVFHPQRLAEDEDFFADGRFKAEIPLPVGLDCREQGFPLGTFIDETCKIDDSPEPCPSLGIVDAALESGGKHKRAASFHDRHVGTIPGLQGENEA